VTSFVEFKAINVLITVEYSYKTHIFRLDKSHGAGSDVFLKKPGEIFGVQSSCTCGLFNHSLRRWRRGIALQ